MLVEAEMYHCKTTMNGTDACTLSHAVISSDWKETGDVKLLGRRGNITENVIAD
jgi:hypothetical protein